MNIKSGLQVIEMRAFWKVGAAKVLSYGHSMGGKARVSEFFAGRRRLSIEQVRALRDLLHIPADLLIG